MIELSAAFLLSVASIIVPVLALAYSREQYRSRLFLYVPIGITFQFVTIGIVAAAVHGVIEYGWIKYFIVVAASTLIVDRLLQFIEREKVVFSTKIYNHRAIWIILALSLLAIADSFWIGGIAGYHDDSFYFRPPFQSDPHRNVFLVNALIRHDDSPFLPGAPICYQLLWYHVCALFVSLFRADTNYSLTMGVGLATSYFLFFTVLWAIYSIRPTLFLRYRTAIPLLVIIFSHADIFNFLYGLFQGVGPCLAVDSDCNFGFEKFGFDHHSLKFASLVSPQHLLFGMALATYVGGMRYRGLRSPSPSPLVRPSWGPLQRINRTVALPFFVKTSWTMMFLISPVLSLLLFPFLIVHRMVLHLCQKKWKAALTFPLRAFLLFLFAAIFYSFIFRASPHKLVTRHAIGDNVNVDHILNFFYDVFMSLFRDWMVLPEIFITPVALVGVLGLSGLLCGIFMLDHLRRKSFRFLADPAVFVLFMAAYFTNYVLQHAEMRRHVSIVLPVLAALALARLLSANTRHVFIHKALLPSAAIMALVLHGYYVHSFTFKPSIVDKNIPWRDYICINKIVTEKYKNWPTLGATGGGLRFPLILEATSSFTHYEDAAVHSVINRDDYEIIKKTRKSPITDLAKELRMRLLVWGPIEQNAWGISAKTRLTDDSEILARCGSVSLYRIR
jgi:hypothetical protein